MSSSRFWAEHADSLSQYVYIYIHGIVYVPIILHIVSFCSPFAFALSFVNFMIQGEDIKSLMELVVDRMAGFPASNPFDGGFVFLLSWNMLTRLF